MPNRGQPNPGLVRRLREWLHRFGKTLRRGRPDGDLENELRLHLELAVEDARSRRHPLEVERAARLQAGGVAQAMDALRDQRGLPVLHPFMQDLRHAQRSLERTPGFAAIAVLTLAAGLGATASVFSIVDALLIRPLAVEAPHELFVVRPAGEPRRRFPLEFYRFLENSSTVLSDALASFTFPVTVVASATGTRASAAFVTPNYFEVLRVRPALGRLFHRSDGSEVAVVSHRFWKERLGGRKSAVGEALRIGDTTLVIAGVTPPGFGGLQLDLALDLWMPMSASSRAVPIPAFRPSVDIVGRLPGDLSLEAAAARVNAEYGRFRQSLDPLSSSGSTPLLALISASHGLESGVREAFRASLALLIGICACLWVITIVNVSGLLTARLRERSREIGLRQALGATTSRLFRQLLTEVVVLMSGGLLLGFLLAAGLAVAIPRWIPSWAGIDIHVSPLVLLTTAITAALAAFIVALVPALSVDRRRLLRHLTPGLVPLRGGRRLRLSTCLVAAQLALTLPLIVVAGLLAQSLHHLGRVDTGFARSQLLQVSVEPALVGYPADRATAYYAALIERLRAVPGIADASVSSGGALSGYDGMARLRGDDVWHDVRTNAVDDRYFSTLGIRLVAGRSFDAVEARADADVVVVNDALARRLFQLSGRAIGQVVTFDHTPASERRIIIGVVENTADANLRDRSTPAAYLPVGESSLLVVHVRSVADPAGVAAAVRQATMSLDPNVPILGIETMERRRQATLQRERLLAVTSVAIGWIALVLSAIGIFGRVNQDVIARSREILIRGALGATPSQIANLFLRDTATVLVLSGLVGIAAAFGAARVMQGQLYGVSTTNLTTYIAAAATLALVATGAIMAPLRRARRAGASTQLLRE